MYFVVFQHVIDISHYSGGKIQKLELLLTSKLQHLAAQETTSNNGF